MTLFISLFYKCIFELEISNKNYYIKYTNAGLPHTQGTQGIQGNSGNFQIIENLRELWLFFNSGKLRAVLIFSKNYQEVLRFFKKSQGKFFVDLEWDLVNPVEYFFQKSLFLINF